MGYDEKVLNAIDAPIKMLHICSSEKENPQAYGGLMEDGWFKTGDLAQIDAHVVRS